MSIIVHFAVIYCVEEIKHWLKVPKECVCFLMHDTALHRNDPLIL